MSGLRKEDFIDTDLVDQEELGSDGTVSIFSGVTVVSCTASTKRVVCSGILFINGDYDEVVEPGDTIIITGSTAADGTYTVDSVESNTELDVVEEISDSTGGSLEAKHRSGASRIGIDPTNISNSTATNIQDALEDIDDAVACGPDTHKTLRQLIHFISEGPAEGFASGAYREQLPSGDIFPTSVIWYTDSGKTDKIVERLITWTGVNVTQDKWKIYDTDGSTVLWTITDAISYSGIVETNRTRTITSGDA